MVQRPRPRDRLPLRLTLLRALVNDALGIIFPGICQFEGHVVEGDHMTAHVEQLEFQAEARQLLDLLVHSVYSNKDSFLRELISNASDALDKLRLETLRNKDLDADTSDLHIEIEVDEHARTLTVRDNGIGMTHEEVVDLIGTLAKSGTAELRQKLREAKNAAPSEELIGQFGIGFYSTFMVSDKVELLTRKAGESEATWWESSGGRPPPAGVQLRAGVGVGGAGVELHGVRQRPGHRRGRIYDAAARALDARCSTESGADLSRSNLD
jgi:Histidine kinase-, DNA gyrase B-, and HSP90-like ATPase